MTDYELTNLKLIAAVLRKWLDGDHKGRYPHHTRQEDRERLREIETKIKTYD